MVKYRVRIRVWCDPVDPVSLYILQWPSMILWNWSTKTGQRSKSSSEIRQNFESKIAKNTFQCEVKDTNQVQYWIFNKWQRSSCQWWWRDGRHFKYIFASVFSTENLNYLPAVKNIFCRTEFDKLHMTVCNRREGLGSLQDFASLCVIILARFTMY